METNNSENSTNDDNGQSTVEDPKAAEREKYWKAVRDNPSDFTGWTYLLQFLEQENKPEHAREGFNAFLDHYPYCFGYWKKYSDLEKRNHCMDKAQMVFEKGVHAIPLSVELWIHYVTFTIAKYENKKDMEEEIRSLYERAISAAGTEFRSDRLWDSYVNWEKSNKKLDRVCTLYDRLISIPTQLYSHHFENFKLFVENHNPHDFLSLDEFLKLRREVVDTKKVDEPEEPPGTEDEKAGDQTKTKSDDKKPADDKSADGDNEDDGSEKSESKSVTPPPGEEAPPGSGDTPVKIGVLELAALRKKVIEARKFLYLENEEEVSKRWMFEEGIKRPYFHVKPLERSQLKNWREYMTFEMENGSHERIVVLFERCLIACAFYEDFWMKYIRYLEGRNLSDAAKTVFRRACKIHLPKKPTIHLAWAAFEEKHGNPAVALDILTCLEKNVPGLAMISLRRIGIESRHGHSAEVDQMFNTYLNNADTPELSVFYTVKYVRYLTKIAGDSMKAKVILKQAIEKNPKNTKLYLQLLDIDYQAWPINQQNVLSTFDMVLDNNDMSMETKVLFSRRKLEFLEDFGTDINSVEQAYEAHQKLMKEHTGDKKRKPATNKSVEPANKKSKPSATTPAADIPLPPTDGSTTATAAVHPTQTQPSVAYTNDLAAAASYYAQWAQYGAQQAQQAHQAQQAQQYYSPAYNCYPYAYPGS